MTDLLGDVVEGFGKLVAEEAGKIFTQENVSHLARQVFSKELLKGLRLGDSWLVTR